MGYNMQTSCERTAYIIMSRDLYNAIMANDQVRNYMLGYASRLHCGLDFDAHRLSVAGDIALYGISVWQDMINADNPLNGDKVLQQWVDAGYITGWYWEQSKLDENMNKIETDIHDYLEANKAEWEAGNEL